MDSARFERIFVPPTASIRDAIEAIDAGAVEIALVADEQRRLVGTVSDGDVRRALLRGVSLDEPVTAVFHDDPITAPDGTSQSQLLGLMTERGVEQIPIVRDGVVVDLAFIRELVGPVEDPYAFIMAGGEGQRLRPLTEDVPKPMLTVGDRPLLETILGRVRETGFSKIFLAVNYRAEMIESHFGDGSDLGLDITYVREEERLGSAGALALAREELDRPFIVVNADLLTDVNFGALLKFHGEEGNLITVGVRRFEMQVPYGVVELDGTRVSGLREKPVLPLFVNAGVYAADPAALELLPAEIGEFNMTDLIDAALTRDARVGGFPIREYWLDIGHLADYQRAHDDHATYFSVDK